MAAPLAVVGLGNMGSAIAEKLHAAGHDVRVWSRSPRSEVPEAERLRSAGDALAACDVCLSSLADDDAVDAVLPQVLRAAVPGTVLVEMSTISVAASERIARAAEAAEVAYLRAPVSGNPAAIRAGTAAIFVSGPADAAARVEPLLAEVAPTVRYVGDGEQARVLKLVLQVMVGGTAALLAEALVLGEAAGVERAALLEAISASVAGSRFVDYKTKPLLEDDYSATFTTAMLVKDVDLVLDLAGDTGVELPLTDELRALSERTCAAGHADRDFISILLYLRGRREQVAR